MDEYYQGIGAARTEYMNRLEKKYGKEPPRLRSKRKR